ncbi:hypothetical protein AOLI_G00173240 [Acnodon oligacanthus]
MRRSSFSALLDFGMDKSSSEEKIIETRYLRDVFEQFEVVSEDLLDLTPAVGFTLSPIPHRVCAVSQNA